MIVKSQTLYNQRLEEINFYLLYGSNKGLIKDLIDNVIITSFNDNINTYKYSQDDIISDPNSFKEKIYNHSLFETKKLIIIDKATDKIFIIIKELIDDNVEGIKVILKSDLLEKRSKLREFFERNKKTIIVPNYEDNYQTLKNIAEDFFKRKKIAISNQNLNHIVNSAKDKRENLRNELIKIENFCHNKKTINFNEIFRLVNISEETHASKLVNESLLKNSKKIIQILNENNSSIDENIMIIKIFLNKLKRLKDIKKKIIKSNNIDEVFSTFKPAIFWSEKDIIKKQLKIYTEKKISSLIAKINNVELILKKNSNNHILLTNNFIFDIINSSNN